MSKIIRIDGDVIVYQACFVSESETPQKAKVVAHSIIKSIKKDLQPHGFDAVKVYITPSLKENFRYKLWDQYKIKRSQLEKPKFYDEMRAFLLQTYGATMAEGEEADDLLGIEQCRDIENSVIATIDKDLYMIPGLIYNFKSKKLIKASDPGDLWIEERSYINIHGKEVTVKDLKGYGFKWFCAQCLTGDTADEIPGISGIGPIKAFEILEPYVTTRQCWDRVVMEYKEKEDKNLYRNATMLWIRRKPDEVFSRKMLEEYLNDDFPES